MPTAMPRFLSLLLPLFCATLPALPAVEAAPLFSGRASDEVPAGTALKDDLARLTPAARIAALARLAGVPTADAAALRADGDGHLFYRCLRAPSTAPAAKAAKVRVAGASRAAPVAPIYHSRPGSANVLFLDFNGGTVSGTIWNGPGTGVPTATSWNCLPFDRDGDETTFNGPEQQAIADIWARVSEDYAPFDIDVTTEPPATMTNRTAWALITPDVDADGKDCPHKDAGGIAYVDVFGDSQYASKYSPAWVWSGDTFTDTSNIAEAAAHEVGHNMGLNHDGRAADPAPYGPAGYAVGFAATASSPSWGPIMGAPYGRTLSLWSKGEYNGATNTQDDLAIIAGKLGYVPDDHGTGAGATALAVVGGAFSANGVVGAPGDSDGFAFTFGGGQVAATVTPYASAGAPPPDTAGGDLDVRLTLRDAGGAIVASSDPNLQLGASFTATVASGSYTLVVEPAAKGNPTSGSSPSGYTIYGVAGQYAISGTLTSSPVLAVTPASPVTLATARIGASSDTTLTIANTGSADLHLTAVNGAGLDGTMTLVGGGPSTPQTIAPGGSVACVVRFTPTTTSTRNGTLTITTADAGSQTIALSATGLPALSASPGATVAFGSVVISNSADRTISISNASSSALMVTSFSTVLGSTFTVVGGLPATPISLAPGALFNLTLHFAPTAATASAGSIVINTDSGGSLTLSLSGTGTTTGGDVTDDGASGGGGCGAGSGVGLILGLLAWRVVSRSRRKRS